MLYLLQLVIHMRYGQVSVSKELEPITQQLTLAHCGNRQKAKCSQTHVPALPPAPRPAGPSCTAAAWSSGRSRRPTGNCRRAPSDWCGAPGGRQHGEGAGWLQNMHNSTRGDRGFSQKVHHLFNSSITDTSICYQYQMSTLLVKYVPIPWHLYQLYCICMTILFCLFTLFYKNMLRNVVQIADKYRKIKTKLKVIL